MTKIKMKEPVEHGIDSAFYSNTPGGLRPTLVCLCDHVVDGDTWEEAGAALDEHHEEMRK